jgi:hypothetical protein
MMLRKLLSPSQARLGAVLLILLLLLSSVAFSAIPPSLASENTPEPASPTPLVPNIEPDPDLDSDHLGTLLDTSTMTETVQAVVAEFNALPQPALAPEEALIRLESVDASVSDPTTTSSTRICIPMVMARKPVVLPIVPAPTATPNPEPGADVAVAIWAKPSVRVARNNTLAYEIRLMNYGKGAASSTRVVMPYHRNQYTLTHTKLTSAKGDWVSSIGQNSFTVTFGPLAAGEERLGTVYLKVAGNLADNTVISVRDSFDWSDKRDGGRHHSNWMPVVAANGDADSPWVWLYINQVSGKPGTVHKFFTDRFIPGERVTTWLNLPTGAVKALDLKATADSEGRIWLEFASTGLTPGNYSMVVYGNRSQLTALASFVVER